MYDMCKIRYFLHFCLFISFIMYLTPILSIPHLLEYKQLFQTISSQVEICNQPDFLKGFEKLTSFCSEGHLGFIYHLSHKVGSQGETSDCGFINVSFARFPSQSQPPLAASGHANDTQEHSENFIIREEDSRQVAANLCPHWPLASVVPGTRRDQSLGPAGEKPVALFLSVPALGSQSRQEGLFSWPKIERKCEQSD